jgi:hypothetical protein
MPLGTDNVYVPLDMSDIGSIISFTLASNVYKEGMIKTNYMDISQKIKGLAKTRNQAMQPPHMNPDLGNHSQIRLGEGLGMSFTSN